MALSAPKLTVDSSSLNSSRAPDFYYASIWRMGLKCNNLEGEAAGTGCPSGLGRSHTSGQGVSEAFLEAASGADGVQSVFCSLMSGQGASEMC